MEEATKPTRGTWGAAKTDKPADGAAPEAKKGKKDDKHGKGDKHEKAEKSDKAEKKAKHDGDEKKGKKKDKA
jgi:hypothetical protein